MEVYFDDFRVEHRKSPVVQSQDYYPFGAVFNSYSRENSLANNWLYQSKEWENDLSLGLYDSEWRRYDPWNVRTTTMDPHGESYPSLSSYSWATNNPISIMTQMVVMSPVQQHPLPTRVLMHRIISDSFSHSIQATRVRVQMALQR